MVYTGTRKKISNASNERGKNFLGGVENKERKKKCKCLLYDDMSREIYEKIISFRISHNYRKRPVYSRWDQYFPEDIILLNNHEVFIDCGAYNGDTVKCFLKNVSNKYRRIIAFEPDKNNINSLKKVAGNITIINAVVWSCNTKISFKCGNGSSSHISNDTSSECDLVQAVAIDDIRECADASFIKMDIEGSEYDALLGAYHTICRNRPKLAICIYHSEEDMLRILELINGWNLDYRFYVRHHAQKISETVLYAVQ